MTEPRREMRAEPSPFLFRYLSEAGWSTIALVTGRGLSAVTAILLAHLLGPRAFGGYVVAFSFMIMLSMLAAGGVGSAANTLIPKALVRGPKTAGGIVYGGVAVALGIGSLVAIAGVLFSGPVAAWNHHPELRTVFALAALGALAVSQVTLGNCILQGFREFRRLALRTLVGGIAVLGATALGAKLGHLTGALVGQIIGNLVNIALVFVLIAPLAGAIRRSAPSARGAWSLVAFALPMTLGGVLTSGMQWMIGFQTSRSAGLAEAGFLGAALYLAGFVVMIVSAISGPLLPTLSGAVARGDRRSADRITSKQIRYTWLISLTIGVALSTAAPLLVRVVYGGAYAPAGPMLAILSFSAVFMVVGNVIGVWITATERLWQGVAINVTTVCLLAVALPLGLRWGGQGAALALAGTYAVHVMMLLAYGGWRHRLPLGFAPRALLLTAVCAVVLAFATPGEARWLGLLLVPGVWLAFPLEAAHRAELAMAARHSARRLPGLWKQFRRVRPAGA